METDKSPEQALQECEEQVKHLEDENQHLREASHAFGQLAERLNETLQEERRSAGDRRQRPRHYSDRRQSRESTMRLPRHTSLDKE